MAARTTPALITPDVPVGKVMFTTDANESIVMWVNGVAKPLAAAYGGYGSTARTGRRARTTYQGVDVGGMTIPVLLDGWADRLAVTPQRRKLQAMASPSGTDELTPPQAILVTGSVPINGQWWVIQSLEPGDNIRLRAADGVALRSDYVVTVIEPPDDDIVITNGKRYTVRPGDTLTSIAARQLGSAKRWHDITNSAGHRIRDPKSVKPGQIVRLP